MKEKVRCFNCGRLCHCDRHHIFGGPNRPKSERYGLVVLLCRECHEKVHRERSLMDELRRFGQRLYNSKPHDRPFVEEFGYNYLDDPDEELDSFDVE